MALEPTEYYLKRAGKDGENRAPIYFAGNLTCSNRALQGIVTFPARDTVGVASEGSLPRAYPYYSNEES